MDGAKADPDGQIVVARCECGTCATVPFPLRPGYHSETACPQCGLKFKVEVDAPLNAPLAVAR